MCRSPIFCILVVCSACAVWAAPPDEEDKSVRKLHFIQDDAQDYMVSKLYELKYAQANDLVPFVQGMIMRYNTNSSAGSITYGTNNSQMLAVTCPVKMMPYVDDFIRLVDRPVKLDGKIPGEIIQGTGITRAVYRPKYRSGENILNVLVNSVIGEGPWIKIPIRSIGKTILPIPLTFTSFLLIWTALRRRSILPLNSTKPGRAISMIWGWNIWRGKTGPV